MIRPAPRAEDLQPTYFIDSDHEQIRGWAHAVVEGCASDLERAVCLYQDVRDGIFYNPYRVKLRPSDFRASHTLQRGRAFCIPKAIVLAAGARAVGIPCRLGFSDVRNHLTSAALREALRTDTFYFHGYVVMYLRGQWVKATPTFNLELCERAGVAPLEFDGIHDALFQPYDLEGQHFMEYVHDHGCFGDFPYGLMAEVWRRGYPHLFEGPKALELDGDFATEVIAG